MSTVGWGVMRGVLSLRLGRQESGTTLLAARSIEGRGSREPPCRRTCCCTIWNEGRCNRPKTPGSHMVRGAGPCEPCQGLFNTWKRLRGPSECLVNEDINNWYVGRNTGPWIFGLDQNFGGRGSEEVSSSVDSLFHMCSSWSPALPARVFL